MMIDRHASARVAGIIVTSGMGMRVNPILGRRMFHAGTDLAASVGAPVRATADGDVARAGWAGGYGLLIVLHHQDGYETRYGHLSRVAVSEGEAVRKGQLIGYVGTTGRSTGPHLHYEIRHDGEAINPLPYLHP
jgi:murein DD-endopeptidase MepM/ murein hydrolase activator NlpD